MAQSDLHMALLPHKARQGSYDAVVVSIFLLEFIVGICMLVIVAWLLLFQMKEVKECRRIGTDPLLLLPDSSRHGRQS